ncbi:MAG: Mfa1 fimbrilin C-terminal domain-containing protein [Bacteroides sp.]|nr:Mfa1 fimbrilin C-terminal domain-containing protein [Bacteroides sp.]
MKNFGKFMMAALLATGLWACSEDAVVTGEGEDVADEVYMSFDLQLPTVTRSATDENSGTTNSDANPDSEVGNDSENKVSSVVVVLATESNGTYTHAVESSVVTPVGSGDSYVATFEADNVAGIAGQQVAVFVICNPTETGNFADLFTANSNAGRKGTVASTDLKLENSIAKANNFLMTNSKIVKTGTLPAAKELAKYNSTTNPYPLGEVEVERAAARFDYKAAKQNNTYAIKDKDGNETGINIVLTDVALMNLSKEYYYLRRVAAASTTATGQYDPANETLCGVETSTNYVVDTDAAGKLAGTATVDNFYYNLGAGNSIDPTTFTYTALSEINGETKWTTDTNYKIWRYATENTMPSIGSQKHKYTTGVVFKGKITETETDESKKLLDGESAVYVYANTLYGSWAKVKAAATATDANADLAAAYAQVGETENKEAAVAAQFTVYEPNDSGDYEVYYYYWNRHNNNATADDPKETEMGVMEFAVVRNNVYKLSVTDIALFGHPADPDNDPDEPDPDDPDESTKVYFRVAVKVLPWVVRVNNIEF